MAVLFTAMFSAASVVWDREYGFLREMLVAPVRRGAIVLGKCFGGATVASFQGVLVMALAPLVGVPYSLAMIAEVLGLQLLLAFMITAFGVMAAARITQMQAFMALMQMIVMPLLFLSGALFPLTGLPQWLAVLNRIDPLTYAVDPIRHAVFAQLAISPAARAALLPGVTWFGWHVPIGVEVLVVALFAVAMVNIAMWQFRRA
jgi:ABC-2 type transport system permease protein